MNSLILVIIGIGLAAVGGMIRCCYVAEKKQYKSAWKVTWAEIWNA